MGILQDKLESFDIVKAKDQTYIATQLQAIRTLFESGNARPNETYPVRMRNSHGEIVQINVPIINIVLAEKYPVAYLALFIDFGANINCTLSPYQETPLHYCIGHFLDEKTALLLKSGADFNQKTSNGFTPLMTAVDEGNNVAVEQLLRYTVSLRTENTIGKTVLDLAYQFHNRDAAAKIEEALKTPRASHTFKRSHPSSPEGEGRRLRCKK